MSDKALGIYDKMDYQVAVYDVMDECINAVRRFPPYNSAHEGWAVIREELDELWDEVRRKQSERSSSALRHEAMQIAVTALRFMVEVDGGR